MKILPGKLKIVLLLVGLLVLIRPAYSQKEIKQSESTYISSVRKSDNGDGTYANPVLFANYSDPDVIRVDDDFFMTPFRFNDSPGLPILHFKDLN